MKIKTQSQVLPRKLRYLDNTQYAQGHVLVKAKRQPQSPQGPQNGSKKPSPSILADMCLFRQNDGCDDLSRSLPPSRVLMSCQANNCCHQVLGVRPRPVTNSQQKVRWREPGLLNDHSNHLGLFSFFFLLPLLSACVA